MSKKSVFAFLGNCVVVLAILWTLDFGLWTTQAEAADTTIKGTTADSTAASLNVTNSADTSLLYVRNSGNVGIGTTGPGEKLTVSSPNTQGMFSVRNSSNSNLQVFTVTSSSNNAVLNIFDSTGAIANQINGSGSSYFNAGNVGIGTTGPDDRLHVFAGSAGTVTSTTNSVLTIENSGQAFIQMLTPSTTNASSGLILGDEVNTYRAGIVYNPV